ncbi:MAG: hypothetical protein RLZZ553_345 [Verrucomicrobiota bacterium]
MKHLISLLSALMLVPVATLQAQLTPCWVLPEMNAPRVQRIVLDSKTIAMQVSYHVFTPEIYQKEKSRQFPVLYWLHGTGGGMQGIPKLSSLFDRAMQEGKIPPMIVVFPNGLKESMWCDSKDNTTPVETLLIREIIPHVDETHRTIKAPEGRIIEGFSMGGFGAARLGFKHPQLFGAVSILAGGPLDLDFRGARATANPAERARIMEEVFGDDIDYYKAQHPITIAEKQAELLRNKIMIRIAVGSRDRSGMEIRAYSERLTKLKIEHAFTIVPEVGHDTLALLNGLGEANWRFYQMALNNIQKNSLKE